MDGNVRAVVQAVVLLQGLYFEDMGLGYMI